MTIDTEQVRNAAAVLDTLTSNLAADNPLRTEADVMAKGCVATLYTVADQIDAQTAEIAAQAQHANFLNSEIARLRGAIQGLLDALPSATTHPAIQAAKAALKETCHD